MRAAACFLAALLLVATACSFERRSPDQGDGGSAEPPRFGSTRTPSDTAADSGRVAAARSALVSFQEARRNGDRQAVRSRLAPEAVILGSGRSLAWRDDGPGVDTLLAPASSLAGWEHRMEGRSLGGDVLFVLGYPADGPGAPSFVETLLLTPDSGEWRVRLLHRTPAR